MNSDSNHRKLTKKITLKNFYVLLVSTFIFSWFSNPVFATSDGLVVDLDASNSSSYSGTGSTWTNLVGPANLTISNGSFENSGGIKSIVFNGTSTLQPFEEEKTTKKAFNLPYKSYQVAYLGARF
jgi:hypothetical protein